MDNEESLKKLAASIDKVRPQWGEGPWTSEPDRKSWTTKAGHPALIVRTKMGHLCGYVAVERSHPLYGKSDSDPGVENAPCHGGITYANKCAGPVCHVPEAGKPDDVWWFGFDCAHCDDFSPSSNGYQTSFAAARSSYGTYRTFGYVENECEELAAFLAGASHE